MHTKEGTGTEAESETNGAEPEIFNRIYLAFCKNVIIYGLGGANKVRDGIGGGMGNERDGK